MCSDSSWSRAVIIGSSGGIGSALARRLNLAGVEVHGLSRSASSPAERIDILDESSVAEAAARVQEAGCADLVIVASGLLHGEGLFPEKSWRDLSINRLTGSFAINAAGPALVAKHFLPLLPRRGPAVFAALWARVGSIGDNRLGGWHGYRSEPGGVTTVKQSTPATRAGTASISRVENRGAFPPGM